MITKTLTEELKNYRKYLEDNGNNPREVEIEMVAVENFINYLKLYEE